MVWAAATAQAHLSKGSLIKDKLQYSIELSINVAHAIFRTKGITSGLA